MIEGYEGRHELPLVSIVVVNFNYGRYLRQIVASIYAQTYARIECILVDNGSTDESSGVLSDLADTYPDMQIVRRLVNDGQSAAALDGFAASRGMYVIFMDADDYLLPRAVEAHLTVHLSSRIHVGFTSVDMLQILHDQVVLSTGEAVNKFIASCKEPRRDVLRANGTALGHLGLDTSWLPDVYFVPPGSHEWVWSPTSGNCYRRDALTLFTDNTALRDLRTHTDFYFNVGISTHLGSILIDDALFVYRLHDSNVSAATPHLNGRLAFNPARTGKYDRLARRLLVDHLTDGFALFVQEPWMVDNYTTILKYLDIPDDDRANPRWMRRSRAAARLMPLAKEIRRRCGFWPAVRNLLRVGVPIRVTMRLLLWPGRQH